MAGTMLDIGPKSTVGLPLLTTRAAIHSLRFRLSIYIDHDLDRLQRIGNFENLSGTRISLETGALDPRGC